MISKVPDLFADPFGERSPSSLVRNYSLLGARFRFESNATGLLSLAEHAYDGLPGVGFARQGPLLRVRLQLTSRTRKHASTEPPLFQMLSGAGLLAGALDGSTFVVLSPHERTALVAVSPAMLRFPYHTRYELIEFAVFTLAARAQRLVSLHGACVGRGGRGVLLMGPSGSGKSTVTLQSLLAGLDFLAEDSVFVTRDSLLATGVPNFLHVRSDSLRWVTKQEAMRIRASRVIQRRSGARKYELDLRSGRYRLADRALKICAIVFLSARNAGRQSPLVPLSTQEALARLSKEQAYAASQPTWREFARNAVRLPVFELRRGQHPGESVDVLNELMEAPARPVRRSRHF